MLCVGDSDWRRRRQKKCQTLPHATENIITFSFQMCFQSGDGSEPGTDSSRQMVALYSYMYMYVSVVVFVKQATKVTISTLSTRARLR